MAIASQSPDELLGELTSSKFRVTRHLGTGGMGSVFEAEHLLTKRLGALKLLHKEYASEPEVVERFTREASAAGRINNPHIVETFDAGRLESGQPYIFMELLSGEPLENRIQTLGSLDFDEAISICIQAASGLVAAHRAGIIHRDIKPANLFLVRSETTQVKLLDFGISKFGAFEEVSRVTQEGTTLGTPHYMPVEQVMGRNDIDERVDVYALGVVLYEAVTGAPPFNADTLLALSIRIHEGRYTPVSQLRPDTPPGFDDVVARSIAVDRDDRYPSMAEFLTELLRLGGRRAESMAPTLVGTPAPAASKRGAHRTSGPAAHARPGTPSADTAATGTVIAAPPSGAAARVWAIAAVGVVAAAAATYLVQREPAPSESAEAATASALQPSLASPTAAANVAAIASAVTSAAATSSELTPGTEPTRASAALGGDPPLPAAGVGSAKGPALPNKPAAAALTAVPAPAAPAPAGPSRGATVPGLKRDNPFD
jgi:eukaryotic-like serine/threonine-protein kinase